MKKKEEKKNKRYTWHPVYMAIENLLTQDIKAIKRFMGLNKSFANS